MYDTLVRFTQALRHADIEVSPAEALDAALVWQQVGWQRRDRLRDALALCLAKNVEDKTRFTQIFENFFQPHAFEEQPKRTLLQSFDLEQLTSSLALQASPQVDELVSSVLHANSLPLALNLQRIFDRSDERHLHTLRDKSRLARSLEAQLGLGEIQTLQQSFLNHSGDMASALGYVRRYVKEQVQHFVDLQYAHQVDASGRRAVLNAAVQGQLQTVPREYEAQIIDALDAFVRRLRRKHRRRFKREQRGQLDVRHMLRRNVAFDGHFFELAWRRRKPRRDTIFLLCDVSGSVARLSRFMLFLTFHLSDLLPHVRAFAFSSQLGEITATLQHSHSHQAIETAIFDWGHGATDYGRAFTDFRALAGRALNHHSTVIVLGDGRSNFYPPRTQVLKEIGARAKQVWWLNPEDESTWGEGDSDMQRYAPYCLLRRRLSSLQDLERIGAELTHL